MTRHAILRMCLLDSADLVHPSNIRLTCRLTQNTASKRMLTHRILLDLSKLIRT